MKAYGQFCSLAMAAQILGQRWTLLVLRELVLGACRFNDIRRGVPLMSPALLTRRPKELQDAGIVVRVPGPGRAAEYRLTSAGRALAPLLDIAARWGRRWARTRLAADQLDPGLLMWYVRRYLDPGAWAAPRTVICVEFSDVPANKARWWLLASQHAIELCLDDPGFEVDVHVTTDLRTLTEAFVGDLPLSSALSSRALRVSGATALVRSFERWWPKSPYAVVQPAPADQDGPPAVPGVGWSASARGVRPTRVPNPQRPRPAGQTRPARARRAG